MKPVLIEWIDAVSVDEWTDISEAIDLQPHTISTLGWLVTEDDTKVVVACSWDRDREGVAGYWAIPKTWLIFMKEIEI